MRVNSNSVFSPIVELPRRQPPEYFAAKYRDNNLEGGHVIKLGPRNDEPARRALGEWRGLCPSQCLCDALERYILGHLQIGGGITVDNAQEWLDAGASKVIFVRCHAGRRLTFPPGHRHILSLP